MGVSQDSEQAEVIRMIVEKEGTFYETVKQPYIHGFGRPTAAICHPLKRKFAALFSEEASSTGTAVNDAVACAPQPLSEIDYEEEYKVAYRALNRRRCRSVQRDTLLIPLHVHGLRRPQPNRTESRWLDGRTRKTKNF